MNTESEQSFMQGSRYTRECNAAWDTTLRLGLPMPPVRVVVRKNCLNLDVVETLLQAYFSRSKLEAMRGQAFAINCALRAALSEQLGMPLTLGGIIYQPNNGPDTGITYHPTVLGEAFLETIGATLRLRR